ncbi:MAG: hypothetical protein U1E13_11755, partial [Methylophilaceae bacterium]|nr:hypothetical protein [Methylophilaceae bacterium]
WLHNLAPPDKPIPAIRHTSLHLLAQTFWQTRHPSETREINGARAALTANWLRWLPQKNPAKPDRDFLSIGNIDVSSSGFHQVDSAWLPR